MALHVHGYGVATTESHCHPVWLARYIGQAVASSYIGSADALVWETNGYNLRYCMKPHKLNTYDVGCNVVAEKACESNRPAYVIEAVRESDDHQIECIELLHLYIAMGLDGQNHDQTVVLARVRCHDVGVLVLSAAMSFLPALVLRRSLCSSTIPVDSYKKGTAAEIMQRFWGLVVAAGVPTVDDSGSYSDFCTALTSDVTRKWTGVLDFLMRRFLSDVGLSAAMIAVVEFEKHDLAASVADRVARALACGDVLDLGVV